MNKSNTTSQDWADILEEDADFAEDFNRLFNNPLIQEADVGDKYFYNHNIIPDYEHNPDVLQDTYLNMELALSRDD